jgi:hypothetical protein
MREGVEIPLPVLPALAPRASILPEVGTVLCKLDLAETRYDVAGRYYEVEVVSPNWIGEGITELYALQVFWDVDPVIEGQDPSQLANLGLQVSNDNGVTWLVWQDSMLQWVPAVGPLLGYFNDLATVDARIPLLPWGNPRQVRFKIKMIPGVGGLQRPIVRGLALFNKHNMDISEDCARSVKRYLDQVLKVPMYYMAELASPSTTIAIEKDIGLDVTVQEPIKVFNLTNDPARNINLFSSLGGPEGRMVTMLGSQVGQVEVQFVGVPDVFIGSEEFFQVSKMPSVVVFTPRIEPYDATRSWFPELEKSNARLVGRYQYQRLYYKITMPIRVQSSLNREARQMTDAVARILDVGMEFVSVANGELYCVWSQDNYLREDRVAQGIWVGTVSLLVVGKQWLPDEVVPETPLVQKVVTEVGGQNTCNLLLPEHLRRVYRERTESE